MLVTLSVFHVSPLARAQGNSPSEYQLKAAFLFNFAKFIDWPPDISAGPQSSFAICVLGQDPFGSVLDNTLKGKTIGYRPLVLHRLRDKAQAGLCQIVFVSSSESAHQAEIIRSLQRASVLLVGETHGFTESGGTIEFTLDDDRVRFTINTDAVDRSGLKFSSKLLALAKIVHDQEHSKGN